MRVKGSPREPERVETGQTSMILSIPQKYETSSGDVSGGNLAKLPFHVVASTNTVGVWSRSTTLVMPRAQ